MTRLIEDDLKTISLKKYDNYLKKVTGADLLKIGEKALNIKVDTKTLADKKVRVVPITSGEGIISGFSQSVADIIKYIGFENCEVTEHSDVWGYSEAYNDKADIIFAADDDRFISINTRIKMSIIINDKQASNIFFDIKSIIRKNLTFNILRVNIDFPTISNPSFFCNMPWKTSQNASNAFTVHKINNILIFKPL